MSNAKNETYLYNYDSKNGRRLTSLQKWTNMISYAYDETGLRTEKSTNTNRTYFDRDASGNLVHEFRDYSGYLGEDSHLYYYYDANGSIGSISYNGVRYAFRKNLQGDIIAILDTSGNVAARYTYDAWGKVLSVTDANGNANTSSTFIGNVNPIRYRGYYYDTETGWYYLNSRYYDPQVKRFINADTAIGANGRFSGMNLFAYCNNNPVNYMDYGGFVRGYTDYRYSHRIPSGPDGAPRYEEKYNPDEVVQGSFNTGTGERVDIQKPLSPMETLDVVVDAISNNIEISGGVGTGLEVEAALSGIEGGGGIHADLIACKWSKSDGFDMGQELGASLGVDIGPWTLGAYSNSWDSQIDNSGPIVYEAMFDFNDSIPLFSIKAYALWGGHFDISLKWKDALKEIIDNL